VVREDPKLRNLLYAGTELGVFASWDGGGNWVSIRNNLPPVAVNDLAVHPRDNDLIIGTHGRGAWILDNITPLQQLAAAKANDFYLFDIRPATRTQLWGKDAALGSKTFVAQNPPQGAMIDYYLKADVQGQVTITIADSKGQTIRTIRGAANKAGVNRSIWDLRYDGPPGAGFGAGFGGRGGAGGFGGAGEAGARGGGGAQRPGAQVAPGQPASTGGAEAEGGESRGRFGFGGGAAVMPGEYAVTINAGGKRLSKPLKVRLDPKIKITEAELAEQLNAGLEMRDLVTRLNRVVQRVDDLTNQLNSIAERASRSGGVTGFAEGNGSGSSLNPADVKAALDDLKKLRSSLVRECSMNYRCPAKLREEANSLMGSINNTIAPPTEGQKIRIREVKEETMKAVEELNRIINTTIKKLNDQMSGQQHIVTGAPIR
jgi:predicted transglutaminase-like cysteine proteinase